MNNKTFFYFYCIIFLGFLVSLLMLSLSPTLGVIMICIFLLLQIICLGSIKISTRKILLPLNKAQKTIIAHCDGIIKSIEIIDGKLLNFIIKKTLAQEYYAIKISNYWPFYPERRSPVAGNLKFFNNLKGSSINFDKTHTHPYNAQFWSIIENINGDIVIGDTSIQKGSRVIDIIPNEYLLNDFTEKFFTNVTLQQGDLILANYFCSTSIIFLPVEKVNLQVLAGQTLINSETVLGLWK